jgi:ABC-type glycerol-3-phosphate transport system substrate-binding protein
VTIDDLPYDKLYELELKQLHQGTSDYDVFMVDDPWMPALALTEKGKALLAPAKLGSSECKGFVESTLMVARNVTEAYDDNAKPSCDRDTFYGVPYVGNSQLFVHLNSRPAPRDWMSLLNDSSYFLRSGPGNPIVTDFMPMLWSFSKNSFKTDTTHGIRLEEMEEESAAPALAALMRLGTRTRSSLSITSYDDLDLAIHMTRGTASASIAWSAWAMAMERRAPKQFTFSDLPIGDLKNGKNLPELGVWLLAIPANTSHREDAQNFVSFATSPGALLLAAKRGNPPPLEAVFADPEYRKAVPFHEAQLESLRTARPRPRTRAWKQVETVLGRCLSTIYESESADADLVLKTANATIDKVLGLPDETARNAFVDGFTCQP